MVTAKEPNRFQFYEDRVFNLLKTATSYLSISVGLQPLSELSFPVLLIYLRLLCYLRSLTNAPFLNTIPIVPSDCHRFGFYPPQTPLPNSTTQEG